MNISDEAVEAAARVLALTGNSYMPDDWDKLAVTDDPEDDWRTSFRNNARRILEAAAPMIASAAWEEGWNEGASWPQSDINPYKNKESHDG